jgi:REP-associated tyrosine transposase
MWNYSQNGYYLVTICTNNKEKHFGQIINYEASLSLMGDIAQIYWKKIPEHYPFVNLDAFIIMPNHIHGIIIIDKSDNTVETGYIPSLQNNTLGNIVGGFKAAVTRWCRGNGYNEFSWQPRFYDRIIRNECELFNIRKYIVYNPYKWENDKYYL